MTLIQLHRRYGAVLAQDGIPLHYGHPLAEYRAGLETAILLDRSHEGRIQLLGPDGPPLLNRMSTNKMVNMADGEGRETLFTNANARILERVMIYHRDDHLLAITEPGRGGAFDDFIRRHIFFNDNVQPVNITAQTAQLALHGPNADSIMESLAAGLSSLPPLFGREITCDGAAVFVARRKNISGTHWLLVMPHEQAEHIYQTVMQAGKSFGLLPAGSLTYNTLRIRAGYPAGREISQDYLPLEVGLWDAVSFSKGCYTGQEIIARMESRGRIARTIVSLDMTRYVEAPAEIRHEGKAAGTLTSSVLAPDNAVFALAIVKIQAARPGTMLTVGENAVPAVVSGLPGAQPPYLEFENTQEETG